MSGSSMDGLDLAYCSIEETGGRWSYQIHKTSCISFDANWIAKLQTISGFSAKDLLLTHTAFGKWMGEAILSFIETNHLEHKIHLIASHGHTVFHEPALGMTFQMGDGASIAAITKLPVVSDLRNMDIALGGQGAPIVPIGEKLFWNEFTYFLNIGGICNLTSNSDDKHIAFDVSPANRVLNLLCHEIEKPFDENGQEASLGNLNEALLNELNALDYYQLSFPKSLSNEFGTEVIIQLMNQYSIPVRDKLKTMCVHISIQVKNAVKLCPARDGSKMMITGGGAFNNFLISLLQEELKALQVEVILPEKELIEYKEALVMALIGVLRWREENNVMSSVTGAVRSSVGGALWMGQE